MAIIIGKPVCAICNSDRTADYTATSGCAFDRNHRLFRYCDAPLHFDCLENWEHRVEFSEGYYFGELEFCRQTSRLLAEASRWALVCGPSPLDRMPYYAEVRLREWPMRLYSRYEEWDLFVADGFTNGLSGAALEASGNAMLAVREIVPNLEALEHLRRKTRLDSGQ